MFINNNILSLIENKGKDDSDKLSFVKMAIYAIGSKQKDSKVYKIYQKKAKKFGIKSELFINAISSFLLSSLFNDLEKKLSLFIMGLEIMNSIHLILIFAYQYVQETKKILRRNSKQ